MSEVRWPAFAALLRADDPVHELAAWRASGELARSLPELDRLWGVPQPAAHHPEIDTGIHVLMALGQAIRLGATLPVRWAVLVHDLGKGTTPREAWPQHLDHESRSADLADAVAVRIGVPPAVARLARHVAAEHLTVHRATAMTPRRIMALFERCDALAEPNDFSALLLACEADARGRLGLEDRAYPQRALLEACAAAARATPGPTATTRDLERGHEAAVLAARLAERLRVARIEAIRDVQRETPLLADPPT